jgi:hypothetical protein
MTKLYNLTLTEEQADILGFALAKAQREQAARADRLRLEGNADAAVGCHTRALRIVELRELLDRCPITETA